MDSPVAMTTPATAATTSSAKETVKAPVKAAAEKKPVSVVPTKIKAADKPTTGASFFGKLASAQQTPPTINKTPVPTKPIPKRYHLSFLRPFPNLFFPYCLRLRYANRQINSHYIHSTLQTPT